MMLTELDRANMIFAFQLFFEADDMESMRELLVKWESKLVH